MNFIRNIIAEKRGAKPQEMPRVAPVLSERFDETARSAQLNAAYGAARQPLSRVAPEEESPAENIFAGENSDAAEAAAVAPLEFDEAFPAEDAETAAHWEPESEAEDQDEAADVSFAEPVVEPVRAQSPLSLEAGFLRARRQPDVEEAAMARPDQSAVEPKVVPVPKPADVSEERRLRLAMLADEPQEPAADLPEFFGSAAADAFSPAAHPTNQPSLSEMPFVSVQPRSASDEIITDAGVQVPPPAAGRGSSRSGRVKTRLLGFNPESLGLVNPFEKEENRAKDAFPVAWLVVVDGPGRGASFVLHDGVSRIGRGDDQPVCLNFGDNSISRENHLSIAYDSEQNAFYIGQSGRSNIVRLNNKPLLSTEQVRSGDQIRVGETTLRLVALCSEDFSWAPKS